MATIKVMSSTDANRILHHANLLLKTITEASDNNAQKACELLVAALQLLHVQAPPAFRLEMEEFLKATLREMSHLRGDA